MRMASLLAVFVMAKAAMLAGHRVPLSWWSPVAYFWQDAAVVLIFAGLEYCFGTPEHPGRHCHAGPRLGERSRRQAPAPRW